MSERTAPRVYSIAAHRGFADALVAGLIPRYREEGFGLARLTLLLPSQRAVRTVTEAFVRLLGDAGMLLPRMAVVGDLDLDETLGSLLDPLGAGEDIPPAADPTRRWLRLAQILLQVEGEAARSGAALLRQAFELGQTMDRLLVDGIAPIDLMDERVVGIVGDLADHWRASTRTFLTAQQYWLAELAERGEVDAPTRRNLLFERAAQSWREQPPATPIVAAGVTSASPALARMLRVVSELPQGKVILPDLDLELDAATWDSLGIAGNPVEPGGPQFARGDAVTHPQYHLKLLLNRMGIAREEVDQWHRAGLGKGPPERSKAISNLFLPPHGSAGWVDLPPEKRRLAGVRLIETAHPGEEAQAIAILVRQALETPERRVAVVTPDRGLAARVAAHLRRWGIEADDTAGQPLSQTAPGRLLLLLAETVAEQAAPVPLAALLVHPLVRMGEERAAWLDNARRFDRELRGPRRLPGLEPLQEVACEAKVADWWAEVETILAPLMACEDEQSLADLLDMLAAAGEALCGEALWAEAAGRSLAALVEELREAAREAGTTLDPRELHAVLRDAMDRVSVRPPWGGHPRVSIYGLLEARMSRADLVICGGLVEGVWPGNAAPDSVLPPPVLRVLGVPGADFRIGLSAHDLAAALGAPEVVLSHALRDEGAPVVPSRFVLRVQALLGELASRHRETDAVALAREIDHAALLPVYPRPKPIPSAQQRRVSVSATGLDRLRSDPYQFYASSILGLRGLDGLDAVPSPAWQGSAAHDIMEAWHKAGEPDGALPEIAARTLDEMSAHPLMRALWRPRLMAALEWIGDRIARLKIEEGRRMVVVEDEGVFDYKGVRIKARADRIDALPGGGLAIVDYKTGTPPSPRMVEEGFSLQLGLTGLIASKGGFAKASGTPTHFEYWSFAKNKEGTFGYIQEPVRDPDSRRRTGPMRDDFLQVTETYLNDALDRWILGSEPFTARLNPDIGGYNDFDQLMRLDEWQPHMTAEDWNAA